MLETGPQTDSYKPGTAINLPDQGSTARRRGIPSMTGIRGIAALWVLLFHAQQLAGKIFGLPSLERIPELHTGWHGVDLFFMLSGFILMYAHGRDFCIFRKDSLIRFARLRFTRVYPLNAVVLLLIAAFVPFQHDYVAWARSIYGPSTYSPKAFLGTLFLATRWFFPDMGDWNQPVWSLSLEVLGYVMFPLLAFCALRIVRKWQLIAIGSLSLIASFLVLRQFSYQAQITQIAFARMLSCFVAGIVIFRIWKLSGESAKRWASWITVVSTAGIAISSAGVLNKGQAFHGDIQFNFLFGLLLYGLAFQQGFIHTLLSSRVALFLGEISFPLYLVHVAPLLWLRYFMLVHSAAYSTSQKAASLLGWAIGCLILATLLHYFIEKPFHAWGRRWVGARASQ